MESVRAGEMRRLKSLRLRRACRSSQGPSLAAVPGARANARDGRAEKARQRWIIRSVHRGPSEAGRKPPREVVKAQMGNARVACGIRVRIPSALLGTNGERACRSRHSRKKRQTCRDAGNFSGLRGDYPRLHLLVVCANGVNTKRASCRRPWGSENPRRPRRLFRAPFAPTKRGGSKPRLDGARERDRLFENATGASSF